MDKLLDIAPCGYVAFKDDGTIVYANQTLLRWIGYKQDEFLGKNIEIIFTIASRIFYQTHFFPLLKLASTADEVFLSLRSKEKQDIPVLTNAVRRDQHGQFETHCVLIPVPQRGKYEDELRQTKKDAEKALSENLELKKLKASLETQAEELEKQNQKITVASENLLAFSKIISHDLQEPLRKIQIFTDMIERNDRDKLSADSVTAIQKIYDAARKLQKLKDGLQEYVYVDKDRRYKSIDLGVPLQNAIARVAKERNDSDYTITLDKLPTIQGFETQLELLFFHLVDNSFKFRDKNRKLQIRVAGVELEENIYKISKSKYKFTQHIRLAYSDNGIGFSTEYKTYVLELLKKINPMTEGLGLGLSLIKKIVDNHSGSLQVDSTEGQGSEFIIVLPKGNDS
jgi:sigma-B regulation protein RsbU (phosphoserine phosphatase)